jgi:hypothetical protein
MTAPCIPISRRVLLGAVGALGLGALLGCGAGGNTTRAPIQPQTHLYRLVVGGRRASNAAKKNAANKRFTTLEAALRGRAHPGDSSRPVRLDVSSDAWLRLFGSGRDTADLRHVADTRGVA